MTVQSTDTGHKTNALIIESSQINVNINGKRKAMNRIAIHGNATSLTKLRHW